MKAKVQAGDVDEAVVDASVSRVLNAMDAVGLLDGVVEYGAIGDNVTSPAHAEVAKDIASNATVLLKNDGDVRGELSMLPLQSCDGLVIVGSRVMTKLHGAFKVDFVLCGGASEHLSDFESGLTSGRLPRRSGRPSRRRAAARAR